MAFIEYAFLIKPGLAALGKFVRSLKEAKGDDGKVDAGEFFDSLGSMFEEMWEVSQPIIRDDEKKDESK